MIVSKSINAQKFLELWQSFICQIENNPRWINDYESNSNWTKLIIGSKKSEELNSPLGEFIVNNTTGLRYRKEDGLTDLSFASTQSFSSVLSLHDSTNKQNKIFSDIDFYPTFYEILIEHENNVYMCYEEMAKLTYCRARLKVLITYNENDDSDGYDYINAILHQNFSNIIKQSNKNYPENNQTEYLLLIGQFKNNKLSWNHFVLPDR